MSTVIKVENLSKQYRLGMVGSGTMRDDLTRWWASLRGKEDPFLTVGEANDRSIKGESDYVWSLKDINFEVEQGDILGIIGRNGAGKSTLLKILSKITAPTTGTVKIKGRIASLLEVGTGFHPELTGRENLFLNGAILGMKRQEIKSKLDEIIDFSGVERYIDTPVKRYSSGMYVRLAFSIAAHLEPEILIVDEVLAVGDAEFQKKCLGKMKDVSGQGRTVLFVSHNLQAITSICKRGIILQNGRIHSNEPIDICIHNYFNLLKDYSFSETTSQKDRLSRTSGKVSFKKAIGLMKDGNENTMWTFRYNEELKFKFEFKVNEDCEGLTFYMALKGLMDGNVITNIKSNITTSDLKAGKTLSFNLTIPAKNIRPGQYDLYFAVGNTDVTLWYDVIDGNINLPTLIILPVNDDVHENSGSFTIPYTIDEKNI